jgi:urease accessory protein
MCLSLEGHLVRWRATAPALALLAVPAPARAHLVTTGLGPVYDGVGHVLVSPDDLLPVLAMALLAGLNGATAGRRALFLLPFAWAIGGVAGLVAPVQPASGSLAAVSLLVLGLLVAADRRLSATVVAAVAVLLGVLHGWQNGAAIAVAGREALGLVGIVATVFVLVALGAGLVVSLRAAWARIAVRAAGSWMAAVGLLMVGWGMRGPR